MPIPEADARVYELLEQKFRLFDGVFGASDEVLGAIGSGVEFERRIADIYHGLDEVEQAFQRNREEGLGERQTNRWISNDRRKKGTLQVSRWTFRGALRNADRLFVVVPRQDTIWSTVKEENGPYALSVVLDDRENNEARLYAQVQAQLQARARARARARV